MRVTTCDWDVVSNLLHHVGPNQASCFDCRSTSRKRYFIYCLTYIICNTNQAQTQCISIHISFLAILRPLIKMQHHCRLLPRCACTRSVHLHVTVTCIIFFFQCYVSAACAHAAVAEGAATGEHCCEGVHWPGETEASPR